MNAVDVELWAQVVLYMTNAKFYDERQISFNIYQGNVGTLFLYSGAHESAPLHRTK